MTLSELLTWHQTELDKAKAILKDIEGRRKIFDYELMQKVLHEQTINVQIHINRHMQAVELLQATIQLVQVNKHISNVLLN